ncbi:MAG: hypothetical protein DVB26_07860 [Verrucomicrobia bacterium]|nr:MAG: hypothetical protein DVB26_07860 [Verrucomicrobiota bacterium]
MRIVIFLAGLIILTLGAVAMCLMEKPAAYGFLNGALTLGGGLLICGLFALRSRWHGIFGAGVMALLGAFSGLGNLAALPGCLLASGPLRPAPVLESVVALTCILLFIGIVRALSAEQKRKLLTATHDT